MIFSHDSDEAKAYSKVKDQEEPEVPHSHELIAAAASYEAAKEYEHHRAMEGNPMSHQTATKLLAGFTGAIVDRFVEQRYLDSEYGDAAKTEANRRAENALRQSGQY